MQGLTFEVDSFLVGKTVEIRYNHFDLSHVLIYLDGQFMQKAKQQSISRWNTAKKQSQRKDPMAKTTDKTPKSGIKHLAHLEKQHQQQKIKQAKNLLGQTNPNPNTIPFTQAHFFKAVATALNRKVHDLHANELQVLQHAWDAYGPFLPTFIHTALAKAIIAKGYDQHIDFYIQYIVNSHLKQNNNK
jgi:hypothetical protein